MSLYNISSIKIVSVIGGSSPCEEGKAITYGELHHYELIYNVSGETEVLFQDIKRKNASGFVRYMPKNVKNTVYSVKNIKRGDWIDIYFETETPMPELTFSKDYSKNPNICQLFKKICKTWSQKENGYYNKCVSYFFSILSEMEKSDLSYSSNKHIQKLYPALEYIRNHYSDLDFEYKYLGKLCGISYTYFRKLFDEIFGMSPYDYVKYLKLTHACELLETGRFTVSAVAEMCGYSNIYYFSRVFKESYGVPPSEYITGFFSVIEPK